VIPAGQKDMTRAQFVINTLRLQGVEIGRAKQEVKLKEGTFPAGSYIIKRDQPYGRLAKIMLEKQDFPDQSLRTYDDTGWTMGLMARSDVKEIADKAILDIAVEPVTTMELIGTVSGKASAAYAIADYGSNNMVTLRYRLKDLKVQAAEQSFKSGNTELPAGSFIIPVDQGGKDVHAAVKKAVEELGLSAVAMNEMPKVATHDLD